MTDQKPKTDLEQAADRLAIPLWGRLLIRYVKWASAAVVGVFIAIGLQLVSLNRSIGKVEGEVSRVPASLAQNLLEQSKASVDAGNIDEAVRYFHLASNFIEIAKKNKIPVDIDYFGRVAQQLNALSSIPQLTSDVHKSRMKLAEYSSALRPLPLVPEKDSKNIGDPIKGLKNTQLDPSAFEGRAVFYLVRPDIEYVIPGFVRRLSDNARLFNLTFYGIAPGIYQTLDGFHWKNITFINMRIDYEGGEVELNNVEFVNCTFNISPDRRGTQVLDYATLGNIGDLTLGQEVKSSWNPHTWSAMPASIAGVTFNDW